MNKNKKIISLSVILFVVMLLVSGGSFAYWTWVTASSERTNVSLTITAPDMSAKLTGYTQNITNLIPVSSCTDETYAIKKELTLTYSNLSTNDGEILGTLSIANTLAQVYEATFLPNQAKGNTNGGDITCSNEMMGFTAYQMSIRNEYARIIDSYFSMYGYKVNRLKLPNITGRRNWNYVKTINVNIEGDIPQSDLTIIKSIFDKGITFWHNPNTMYDYSQNNNIV